MNKETRNFIWGIIIVIAGLSCIDLEVLFDTSQWLTGDMALSLLGSIAVYSGFNRIDKSL